MNTIAVLFVFAIGAETIGSLIGALTTDLPIGIARRIRKAFS